MKKSPLLGKTLNHGYVFVCKRKLRLTKGKNKKSHSTNFGIKFPCDKLRTAVI